MTFCCNDYDGDIICCVIDATASLLTLRGRFFGTVTESIILLLIAFLAIVVHNSNYVIITLFVAGLFILSIFFKDGQFPSSLSLLSAFLFLTVQLVDKTLLMMGCNLWISGVGSNRSTN